MVAPSFAPKAPAGLSGYGLNLGATGPRFFDSSGATITTLPCGVPYSFEVPGYTQVFLHQEKDGVVTYDGMFAVPMLQYSAICGQEEGAYMTTVYDPVSGAIIGSAPMTITGPASTTGSFLSSISPTLLLVGAGALLLFMRKGK